MVSIHIPVSLVSKQRVDMCHTCIVHVPYIVVQSQVIITNHEYTWLCGGSSHSMA